MDNLETYYQGYIADDGTTQDGIGFTYVDCNGYVCPYCGAWVPSGTFHQCYQTYPFTFTFPTISNTEKAFNVMKLLVKEQIVKEPNSFKKFCDLIEKIVKVI